MARAHAHHHPHHPPHAPNQPEDTEQRRIRGRVLGIAAGLVAYATVLTMATAGAASADSGTINPIIVTDPINILNPINPVQATLTPPTNLAALVGDGNLSLSWGQSISTDQIGCPVTGYHVQVGTSLNAITIDKGTVPANAIAAVFFTDVVGLTNNQQYWVQVTAVAGCGASSNASAVAGPFTPIAPVAAPGVPGAPFAVAGWANHTVKLTWTAPTTGGPASSYNVFEQDGDGPVTQVSANDLGGILGVDTITFVNGLTNGHSYKFRVVAVNNGGSSDPSDWSSVVKPYDPAAPNDVGAAAEGTSTIGVSWANPTGEGYVGYNTQSYELRYAPVNDGGSCPTTDSAWTDLPSQTGEGDTLQDLDAATTYCIEVRSIFASFVGAMPLNDQLSDWSLPVTATTDSAAPDAPTITSATPNDSTVTLAWTDADTGGAATSHAVFMQTGGTGDYVQLDDSDVSIGDTGATVHGLTNGTSYRFKVESINDSGTATSDPSDGVTPVTTPGVPTSVIVVPGDASATVSWTAPANNGGSALTGYTLSWYTPCVEQLRAVRKGSYAPKHVCATNVGSLQTTNTTATVTGLINGTSYVFQVRASNSVGDGNFTLVTAPVTPASAAAPAVPAAPSGLAVTAGSTSAALTWTAPGYTGTASITGYTVQYSSDGGLTWTTASTTGATSATVTGLTSGTRYAFRVAAVSAAGTGAWDAIDPVLIGTVTPVPATQDATTLAVRISSVHVRAHVAVSLGTTLVDSVTGKAVAGATVQLQVRTAAGAWKTVFTGTTGAHGIASHWFTANTGGIYRWSFAGNTGFTGSTSATKLLTVTP